MNPYSHKVMTEQIYKCEKERNFLAKEKKSK